MKKILELSKSVSKHCVGFEGNVSSKYKNGLIIKASGTRLESLTKKEVQAFSELSKVSSRYSQYETDQELDPRAFSRTSELKQKIIETRDIVRSA